MKKSKVNKKGLTLVEIISVVGIVGLLVGLALPGIIRARELAFKNICIANMKRIKDAVSLWAVEEQKEAGETPDMDDIVPNYLKKWPSCVSLPYEIPSVGSEPACPQGMSDHRL